MTGYTPLTTDQVWKYMLSNIFFVRFCIHLDQNQKNLDPYTGTGTVRIPRQIFKYNLDTWISVAEPESEQKEPYFLP